MSQRHVSKDGKCVYCGSKLRQCIECYEWFLANNKVHVLCRDRCRTRRSRRLKLVKAP
ncbi:hypothetical protein KLER11_gp73 [Pararheinheimera phage vB_PsoM_KLER1-1]|nr:hypothetical protein KLER11_gp73 [Pararheinheimera phage vB_PsoM_KLER1-1]